MKYFYEIDGIKIPSESHDSIDACILEANCGSTGFKGGDMGHGGRHFIRFKNGSGVDMRLEYYDEDGNEHYVEAPEQIEIQFGGDAELSVLIDSLNFMIKKLKEARRWFFMLKR